MALTRVIVNSKSMLPLWRVLKIKGWKCQLTNGANKVCIVCAPGGRIDRVG